MPPTKSTRTIVLIAAVVLAVGVATGIYFGVLHWLPGGKPQTDFPKSSWVNAGYATPEATLETAMWATDRGDAKKLRECLSPSFQNQIGNITDEQLLSSARADVTKMTGYELSNRQAISDNQVSVEMQFEGLPQENNPRLTFQRIGQEWKLASR